MYPHLPLAFSVRQGFFQTHYGAERGFPFPSQFPCGEALECPVILQILARCGAFFIGFIVKGQMNHDFAFRIEVNPCVIEITIGKGKI